MTIIPQLLYHTVSLTNNNLFLTSIFCQWCGLNCTLDFSNISSVSQITSHSVSESQMLFLHLKDNLKNEPCKYLRATLTKLVLPLLFIVANFLMYCAC